MARSSGTAVWLRRLLDLAWYGGLVAAAVVVVLQAIIGASGLPTGVSVPVRITAAGDGPLEVYRVQGDDPGTRVTIQDVSGNVAVENPGVLDRFALHASGWVEFVIGMILIYQLRLIVRTIAAGTPFVEANARRIRVLGFAVIAGELLGNLVQYAAGSLVLSSITAEGFDLAHNYSANPAVIVIGVVILVVAEVFRRGHELQQESDLTV